MVSKNSSITSKFFPLPSHGSCTVSLPFVVIPKDQPLHIYVSDFTLWFDWTLTNELAHLTSNRHCKSVLIPVGSIGKCHWLRDWEHDPVLFEKLNSFWGFVTLKAITSSRYITLISLYWLLRPWITVSTLHHFLFLCLTNKNDWLSVNIHLLKSYSTLLFIYYH